MGKNNDFELRQQKKNFRNVNDVTADKVSALLNQHNSDTAGSENVEGNSTNIKPEEPTNQPSASTQGQDQNNKENSESQIESKLDKDLNDNKTESNNEGGKEPSNTTNDKDKDKDKEQQPLKQRKAKNKYISETEGMLYLDVLSKTRVEKPVIIDRSYMIKKVTHNKLIKYAKAKGVSKNIFVVELIRIGLEEELKYINANMQLTPTIGKPKKSSLNLRIPEDYDSRLEEHKLKVESELGDDIKISKSEILELLLERLIKRIEN